MATNVTTLKNDIKDYIYLRLGGEMIDVELDPEHYTNSINQAFRRYRQRAQNSVESSYLFLDIVANQQEYVLPDEVETVRQVFRRSVGSGSADTGTQFEPFEAAFVNTYLYRPEELVVKPHTKCIISTKKLVQDYLVGGLISIGIL